jgi:hypothetical protein
MGNKVERYDDEVYCRKCREALKYDRENRMWRTKYIAEGGNEYHQCWNRSLRIWDHEPKMNIGRLYRAAKRWLVEGKVGHGNANK